MQQRAGSLKRLIKLINPWLESLHNIFLFLLKGEKIHINKIRNEREEVTTYITDIQGLF